MGLAVSNIRLLTLTARKADCEYNISIDSLEKMALTRQQSALSQEYYAKLKAKTIAYYADGRYNMMDYKYLMGDTTSYIDIFSGNYTGMKKDSSMILTDNNGFVVISDAYASKMKNVLGASCIDADGRGGTFSTDKIPEIIAAITNYSAEEIQTVIQNGDVTSEWVGESSVNKTMSGENVSNGNSYNNSDTVSSKLSAIVSFYYPIFQAAAANGWTTEYNKDMAHNSSYVSDALVTGTFQLQQVDTAGAYKPDASLTYFVTSGLVLERTDSNVREEVTAWYNAEKEALNEKETWLDLEITDLSTELEAIKTEMESLKSLIDSDTEVFNWCNG